MPDPDLVAHVAETSGLTPAEAARVIGDVIAHHTETLEDYVRRRHHELQVRGARNEEIFRTVRAELDSRLVAAPERSERQLRRIVYG